MLFRPSLLVGHHVRPLSLQPRKSTAGCPFPATGDYCGGKEIVLRQSELQHVKFGSGAIVRRVRPVQSAEVIMDRDTGRSKGFGFVEMGSDAEAQAAIEGLNLKEHDGRALAVNEARPREDRRAVAAVVAGGGGRWRRWLRRRRRRWRLRRRTRRLLSRPEFRQCACIRRAA